MVFLLFIYFNKVAYSTVIAICKKTQQTYDDNDKIN